MTAREIIERFGWELEHDHLCCLPFRATCHGFKTPWRATVEEVENDVLLVKSRENAAELANAKPRW